MSEPRYYVDHRIGCVRVADRLRREFDPEGNPLYHKVVWERQWPAATKGRRYYPFGFAVDSADIEAAEVECERLNRENETVPLPADPPADGENWPAYYRWLESKRVEIQGAAK